MITLTILALRDSESTGRHGRTSTPSQRHRASRHRVTGGLVRQARASRAIKRRWPRARRRGSLVETISLPSGAMATAASLKFPSPSGIPTMVKQRISPGNTCAIAIHAPARRNQSTLPTMGRGTGARSADHRPAERPQDLGGEAERGDAEGDRDDEDAHEHSGERGTPELATSPTGRARSG